MTILTVCQVQSWIIRSDGEYTILSIRFISPTPNLYSQPEKYKRLPHNQYKRNISRQREWRKSPDMSGNAGSNRHASPQNAQPTSTPDSPNVNLPPVATRPENRLNPTAEKFVPPPSPPPLVRKSMLDKRPEEKTRKKSLSFVPPSSPKTINSDIDPPVNRVSQPSPRLKLRSGFERGRSAHSPKDNIENQIDLSLIPQFDGMADDQIRSLIRSPDSSGLDDEEETTSRSTLDSDDETVDPDVIYGMVDEEILHRKKQIDEIITSLHDENYTCEDKQKMHAELRVCKEKLGMLEYERSQMDMLD